MTNLLNNVSFCRWWSSSSLRHDSVAICRYAACSSITYHYPL